MFCFESDLYLNINLLVLFCCLNFSGLRAYFIVELVITHEIFSFPWEHYGLNYVEFPMWY